MKRVDENPPSRFPDKPIQEATDLWWIAKVKPRQEKAIAFDFIEAGIEYYLPMFTKVVRRKDNNKPRKSVLPLFPGYISFCAPKGQQTQVFATGRVVNLVEIRHQRRFIDELDQVYRTLTSGIPMVPVESFALGTSVVVKYGPLRGIRGVISRVHDSDRLVLSVEGLGRAAMTIDAAMVVRSDEEPD